MWSQAQEADMTNERVSVGTTELAAAQTDVRFAYRSASAG